MRVFVAIAVFAGSVMLASAPARAQPVADSGYGGEPPGEPISSVDVFYDQLAPYGYWVSDPQLGDVFIPDQDGYVPYRNGHWEYTDVGVVWTSDEPFAWATSHYGRWFFSRTFGRWAWAPDTTWGPSWVDWRETSDGYFGWAPLPPQGLVDSGYTVPAMAWNFAPSQYLFDPSVSRYYVPPARIGSMRRESRAVPSYRNIGRARVIAGPSATVLRQRGITVQPRHLDARTAGRMSAQELQTAETRARQRAPEVQQRNEQRIKTSSTMRKARATPAPPPARRTNQQPQQRIESPRAKPAEPTPQTRAEPTRTPRSQEHPSRVEPAQPREPKPETPSRAKPKATPESHVEPTQPRESKPETPSHAEPKAAPSPHAEPRSSRSPSHPTPSEPKHGDH